MNNSQPDPMLIEMNRSAKRVKIRHLIHRLIYLAIAFSGVRSMFLITKEVLFVYPKINEYFKAVNFSQDVYFQILRQTALVSIHGFFETALGLAMMVKKSHTIHYLHTVAGIIIIALSFYLKRQGSLLDLKELEEVISHIPKI